MSDQAAVREPSAPLKLAKHRIVHVVQKYLLNPPIKLLVRRGLHEVWMPGTAHLLPHDDPHERQRVISRGHPLRWINAMVVRTFGTNLLLVALHPAGKRALWRGELGQFRYSVTLGYGKPRHYDIHEMLLVAPALRFVLFSELLLAHGHHLRLV